MSDYSDITKEHSQVANSNKSTIHSKVSLATDIVIIGGGIAGLMLQARLNNLGYSTLLLEQSKLGGEQSSKAQGIIHGGIKYALLGHITDSAKEISKQPDVWRSYLSNTPLDSNNQANHIDLSETKVVSYHHDLWSSASIKNKLKQILIQKALSSQGHEVEPYDPNYPEVFKNKKFKGIIYRVNETIVDSQSLLANLAKLNADKIIKIDPNSLSIALDSNSNNIANLSFEYNNTSYNITAQNYIFTAGQNNQEIINLVPQIAKMQLRPLHMVMAKFKEPYTLYAHHIGNSMLPIMTITTHRTADNDYIWYIGGKLAETGIYLNQEQQITQAKIEISKLFPWLDTSKWDWASFMVNRAEPLEPNNARPDKAYFAVKNNIIAGWPVKMALAPMLCDSIITHLKQNNFTHKYQQIDIANHDLKNPDVATPIWDELF